MFTRYESFPDYIRSYKATAFLLAVCLLMFILARASPSLYENGTGVNIYIAEGEWWRFITPIFFHVSFYHLLMNGFTLALFGPPLEQRLGRWGFLCLFMAAGIFANAAVYFLLPPSFIHTGASGAIMGLLGFYLHMALFDKYPPWSPYYKMFYTFAALSVLMTCIMPGINIIGHLAGLCGGLLLGYCLPLKKDSF